MGQAMAIPKKVLALQNLSLSKDLARLARGVVRLLVGILALFAFLLLQNLPLWKDFAIISEELKFFYDLFFNKRHKNTNYYTCSSSVDIQLSFPIPSLSIAIGTNQLSIILGWIEPLSPVSSCSAYKYFDSVLVPSHSGLCWFVFEK